jgi:hypothetical protein
MESTSFRGVATWVRSGVPTAVAATIESAFLSLGSRVHLDATSSYCLAVCAVRNLHDALRHAVTYFSFSLPQVVNSRGERWELQFKGAGKTPYSRQVGL